MRPAYFSDPVPYLAYPKRPNPHVNKAPRRLFLLLDCKSKTLTQGGQSRKIDKQPINKKQSCRKWKWLVGLDLNPWFLWVYSQWNLFTPQQTEVPGASILLTKNGWSHCPKSRGSDPFRKETLWVPETLQQVEVPLAFGSRRPPAFLFGGVRGAAWGGVLGAAGTAALAALSAPLRPTCDAIRWNRFVKADSGKKMKRAN